VLQVHFPLQGHLLVPYAQSEHSLQTLIHLLVQHAHQGLIALRLVQQAVLNAHLDRILLFQLNRAISVVQVIIHLQVLLVAQYAVGDIIPAVLVLQVALNVLQELILLQAFQCVYNVQQGPTH